MPAPDPGRGRELSRRAFLRTAAAGALGAVALGRPLRALGQGALRAPGDAVKVGASLALTGPWALDGRNVGLAYAYWAEGLNGGTGLLGRPVRLVVLDDAGVPDRCTANYRRLMDLERCDLLLGPYGSVPAAGALPVLEEAGAPCAIPISASPSLWAQPRRWAVQVTPNADTYMDGPLERAAAAGARTVALVYLDSGFTSDIAAGVRTRAHQLGLRLVADLAYAGEGADFEALLAPVARAEPDVLIGGGYIRSAVGLTRAAHRLRFSPGLICWMEGPHRWPWRQVMGLEGEYVTTAGLWLPSLRTEGNRDFVRGFTARYGSEYAMDMLAGALTVQTAAGYAAALLTQWAVEAAGSLDRDAVRDALFGLRVETPYGRYAVNGNGAQAGKRVVASQWVGGQQAVFWPPEHAEADLLYPAPPWSERV